MADHRQICPDEIVLCSVCEMTLARRDLISHQQDPRLVMPHMMAMQQTIDKLNRRLASVTQADREKLLQELKSVTSIRNVNPKSPLGLAITAISGDQLWEDLRGQQIKTDLVLLGLLRFLSSHDDDIGEGRGALAEAAMEAIERVIDRLAGQSKKGLNCRMDLLVDTGAFDTLMRVLAAFPDDRSKQFLGWTLVLRLLRSKNEGKPAFKAGISERLMGLMEGFPSHRGLQLMGCRALGVMWFNDNEVLAAATTMGPWACRIVTRFLQAFPSDREVQVCGCEAISHLALAPTYRPLLGQIGTCSIVVTAVKAFVKDAEVQRVGCRAITNLSANANNRCLLAEAGACGIIVTVLRAKLDAEAVHMACFATRNFIENHEQNVSLLGRLGICGAILGALEAFPKHGAAQTQGCNAIEKLVASNDIRMGLLVEPSLCQSLVAVLGTCPSALTRCTVISLMVNNHRESSIIMGEAGACKLIVDTLASFPRDPQVQSAGCRCIADLVEDDEDHANNDMLMDLGAWRALNAAAGYFHCNEDIVGNACAAIACLAEGCMGKQDMVFETSICETIMFSLKLFSTMSPAQNNGIWAIGSLAKISERKRQRLVDRGACEVVVGAMSALPDDERRQDNCCGAIASLAKSNETRMSFGDLGACQAVIKAMMKFPDSLDVQPTGSQALLKLALDCEENRARLLKEGAPKVIASAMERHIDIELVQTDACLAIGELAQSTGNKEVLEDAALCKLVIAAAQAFPNDEDVQLAACHAMYHLITWSESNRQAFYEAEGCFMIVASLEACYDHQQIPKVAISVIGVLAGRSKVRKSLGEAGACEAVVKAIGASEWPPDLLMAAYHTLCRLGTDQSNKLKLVKAGAMVMVGRAMELWPQYHDIQEGGALVKERLSENSTGA